MTSWTERTEIDVDPAELVEHELRYAVAAPIVGASATWADLGCGTGIAARRAVEGFEGAALLVDADAASAEQAAAHLGGSALHADLSTREGLDATRGALLAAGAPRAVTSFDLLERLTPFTGLIELLLELAADHDTTVVVGVPGEGPWADGGLEELRSLLPADSVVAQQRPLRGSIVVREAAQVTVPVEPSGGAAPSTVIVAFGPRAAALGAGALVAEADVRAERDRARRREADLAVLEARLAGQRRP